MKKFKNFQRCKRLLSNNAVIYRFAAIVFRFFYALHVRIKAFCDGVVFVPARGPCPPYQSQFGQDFYLEKFGLLREKGLFVEIGCNDPISNSNSYFLEKYFSYTGVSIDALDFSFEFERDRPSTTFIQGCVKLAEVGSKVEFYRVKGPAGWEHQLSGLDASVIYQSKDLYYTIEEVQVIGLDKIFDKSKIDIDILMLDVEGAELQVLDCIPWPRWNISVILVENNGKSYPKKKLQNRLAQLGFELRIVVGLDDQIYTRAN